MNQVLGESTKNTISRLANPQRQLSNLVLTFVYTSHIENGHSGAIIKNDRYLKFELQMYISGHLK